MNKVVCYTFLFSTVFCTVLSDPAYSGPVVYPRAAEFRTPAKLEARVDFWIDVFTKYGRNQSIVHHRDYPQAVFQVLDFSKEAEKLSAYQLERLIKKKNKSAIAQVRIALKALAAGRRPANALEEQVKKAMELVPGSSKKYRQAADRRLVRVQTGICEKYAEAIRRSGRYMHIIEKIFVSENNLPIELTRLPFIESSFDYNAYSSAGAAGIWQFMPRTARLYMKVSYAVDERRDVISSTRGAAKYLKYAHGQLKSWPLALTSYNHGIAGVKRKIKKIGTRNIADIVEHPTTKVFGFASNNFYPEFLAALDVYDNYPRYFPGIELEPPLQVYEYPLPHSFSVPYLQKKLGIKTEVLKKYNYGFRKYAWQGRYRIHKGYGLKVPPEFAPKLALLKAPQPVGVSASSVYGGLVYTVRRGDNLSKIARKYGATVRNIKKLNNLRSDTVYVGQKLKIKERENVPVKTARNLPNSYRVRSGDSLYLIGKKYGASVSQVKSAYNLKSSRIKIGQLLKKTTPSKTPTATKSSRKYSAKGITGNLPNSYRVRRGDSLYLIGKRYGATVHQVMSAYNLTSSRIKVGQLLRKSGSASAPSAGKSSGKYYTVKRGDSLWSISKKFGLSISHLKKLNRLSSNKLKIGQKLKL